MKKLLLFVFAIMAALPHSFAQVRIQMKNSNSSATNDLTKEDMEKLKRTTTIFAYGDIDKDRLDEIKSAFDQAWKITKYKIVPYKELDDYFDKPNYSYLTYTGLSYDLVIYELSLDLWIPVAGKKEKTDRNTYCEIELYPSFLSINADPSKNEEVMDFLYNKAVYNNWTPGYLKYYLRLVNDYLIKGESRPLNGDNEDVGKLEALKTKTLFIPDYVLKKVSMLTGKEGTQDLDHLLSKYPYKYKIVTNVQLNEMILNPGETVYFLVYVKSQLSKYVSVFSTTDGLIYSHSKHQATILVDDDFKDIAKAMK
jgi:hypothetical protein